MNKGKESFFTQDREFYRLLFSIFTMVTLQNVVAYSVNMLDNIMLGSYSQTALSGAATVNQIFFMVQQVSLTVCDALVILASQYYGQKRMSPVRKITGFALKLSLAWGLLPLFMLSATLMAALRVVGTVRISFYISVISLIVNGSVNYTLIFGHFGFPEMGVRGAAIGTLLSRIIEFAVVFGYVRFKDRDLALFSEGLPWVRAGDRNSVQGRADRELERDYYRVAVPVMLTGILWAISVPMQTAILGHLPGPDASDAIAANSVAMTFYQYLKVIVAAMASASGVVMGQSVGRGDMPRIRSDARTLSALDLGIGIVLAVILFVLRTPLLSLYNLSETALLYADQIMVILCFVMIGMSYQMPVGNGILRGSGDTKFTMWLNLISTWAIVMPLSLLAAFVWRLPVPMVVFCIQSDQIFKAIPAFLRVRSGKWIKHLTRD